MSLRTIISVAIALLSACAPLDGDELEPCDVDVDGAAELEPDAGDIADADAGDAAEQPDAGDAGAPPPDYTQPLAPLERTYDRVHGAFVGCDGARVANGETSTDWIRHPVSGRCTFECRGDAKLSRLCAGLGGACVGASYLPGAALVEFCVAR